MATTTFVEKCMETRQVSRKLPGYPDGAGENCSSIVLSSLLTWYRYRVPYRVLGTQVIPDSVLCGCIQNPALPYWRCPFLKSIKAHVVHFVLHSALRRFFALAPISKSSSSLPAKMVFFFFFCAFFFFLLLFLFFVPCWSLI